jgi:predicted NAD-dependent protein-ADP-ribosyltransferase YbiA (DUF1768 family)
MNRSFYSIGTWLLGIFFISSALVACASPTKDGFKSSSNSTSGYPEIWWKEVPRDGAPDWEILPQDAGPGEVILSKRHELGIFSNFATTPITVEGESYASIEGFWQMMKFPENQQDPRALFPGLVWPHTRAEVAQMSSFTAKKAGTIAEEHMKTMGIDWVTWRGQKMVYRSQDRGLHYDLIHRAMVAKFEQNPEVKRLLIATGDLILRPDHKQDADVPDEWKYYNIWMELRSKLK